MRYEVHAPAGLLVDQAGNSMASSPSISSFTILSGSVTSTYDPAFVANLPTITVAAPSANTTNRNMDSDNAPPKLMTMYPPNGATDVPTGGTSMLLVFDEPVLLNHTGNITIRNSSGGVL